MTELLITGGRVWNGEHLLSGTPSIRIAGASITEIGEGLTPKENERVIPLHGQTVVPGLCDTHAHLTTYARQKRSLDLSKAPSREALLHAIAVHASGLSPDEWIFGTGFNESAWHQPECPTRGDLDSLELPNPIHLLRTCGHVHVADTNALGRCGGAMAPNPEGIFNEDEAAPLVETMEREITTPQEMEHLLQEACRDFAALGVTAIHGCSAASYGLGEDYRALCALRDRGELPLRVRMFDEALPDSDRKHCFDGDMLTWGGFKLFLDGALGPRTAALSAPYADAPDTSGILNHPTHRVVRRLQEALDSGHQCLVHAIGDRAIDQFLEVLPQLRLPRDTPGGYPLRLNHLQLCRPDQAEALAAWRDHVVCDIQPGMIPTDLAILGERLGPRRSGSGYLLKSLLDRGMLVCGSSDAGCEVMDQWRSIWAAVYRTDDRGRPRGGWKPRERSTLDEALALFTSAPARSTGRGDRFGRIAGGCRADLAVLDRDIFSCSAGALRETSASLTLLNGEITWEEPLDLQEG